MRKNTKKWTQRDGTKIRICDMKDSHLINSIRMLDRMAEENLSVAYAGASMLQGEMASYYAEQEIHSLETDGAEAIYPIYGDLMEEAYNRKLKV